VTGLGPIERFDWVLEKGHRRAALLKVHNALGCEWVFDAGGRADLVKELDALLGAADLSGRERVRIGRIVQSLGSGPSREPREPRRAAPDDP
jgi:hypothetical protein